MGLNHQKCPLIYATSIHLTRYLHPHENKNTDDLSHGQLNDPNHWALYEEALRYDKVGDVYTAVKLLKKVIRLVPDWPESFVALGRIYHRRREWKPAFHYWKKAVALDADDREAWWHLGLAATGLGRKRVSTTVWGKFGFNDIALIQPLGLELKTPDGYEILWMQPMDASRGRILSIPHPASGMRYRDLMLYDRRSQRGTNVVQRRRVPIFQALDRLKRSPYQTFSCLLHTSDEKSIRRLEQLCFEAGLGFEVWSNASRAIQLNPTLASDAERKAFPEYYSDLLPREDHGTTLAALAAIHPAEVERCLNDWQIITLAAFSDLKHH
jgi:tetratricopeptide (TPR) repeat protein